MFYLCLQKEQWTVLLTENWLWLLSVCSEGQCQECCSQRVKRQVILYCGSPTRGSISWIKYERNFWNWSM